MTIVRKARIAGLLEELDASYQELRSVLEGVEPNRNIYDRYHDNPEQYVAEFTEIDPIKAELAVGRFKLMLAVLGKPTKLAEPQRPRPH